MIRSGATVRHPSTYVFVDAEHLNANFREVTSRWAGAPAQLHAAAIGPLFSANKVFYYDSIDDVLRPGEGADELDARIRQQERVLREISAIQNTHVRYGSVTGGGKRKRRQKEVDILIAVDMMNHAIRGNMEKAVLVTGDRDFPPLVETLVQLGLTVHVAGDFRYTSDVLQEAADYYRRLALHEYLQLVHESTRGQMPAPPSFTDQHGLVFAAEPLASGLIGKAHGRVLLVTSRNCLAIERLTPRGQAHYILVTTRAQLENVQLYLELQYGGASWLEGAITYFQA